MSEWMRGLVLDFGGAAWADWASAWAAAVACGLVSPLVVQRRWAFLGEAVGHSGFGGAGLVWLLATALPAWAFLRTPEAVSAGVLLAALVVATGVGLVTGDMQDDDPPRDRGGRPGFEVYVGLFLVATLALGLLAQAAYQARFNAAPVRGNALLFGGLSLGGSGKAETLAAVAAAAAVAAGLTLYRRDVLGWAVDPVAARLSGVNTLATRLGLLLAVATAAALAARMTGVILVTALLVIPGAAAVRAFGTMPRVVAASVAAAALATSAAVAAGDVLPPGPVVVGVLLVLYAAAAAFVRIRG